jgi:hypothetical protein
VELFCVEEATCVAVGGFPSGQAVRDRDGDLAVAIGVRPNAKGRPALWWHAQGAWGAGVPKRAWRDTVRVVGFRPLMPATSKRGRRGPILPELRPTFRFASLDGAIKRFDTRDDVCEAAGGFRHGDVVRDPDGDAMVCVGVREEAGRPQLFFSRRGSRECGLLDNLDQLRPFLRAEGSVALAPEAGGLDCTFAYPTGSRRTTLELYDIRDEVCLRVGGFKHGQVLRDVDGDESVVIGVRAVDGVDTLFLHFDGLWGASRVKDHAAWAAQAVTVGKRYVPPAREVKKWPREFVKSLRYTFPFRCGLKPSSPIEHFDVRDHICENVGGLRHGQVVRDPDGDELTVVGVRLQDCKPQLYFHLRDAPGAGTIENFEGVAAQLKPVRRVSVKKMSIWDGEESEDEIPTAPPSDAERE